MWKRYDTAVKESNKNMPPGKSQMYKLPSNVSFDNVQVQLNELEQVISCTHARSCDFQTQKRKGTRMEHMFEEKKKVLN